MGFRTGSDLSEIYDQEAEDLEVISATEKKTEEFEALTDSCMHGLGAHISTNQGRKRRNLDPEY